jgi:hypothetical protein
MEGAATESNMDRAADTMAELLSESARASLAEAFASDGEGVVSTV